MSEEDLTAAVQKFMSPRHLEGYVKGVHDHDATKILRGLLDLQTSIGQLQYPSQARALAEFAWTWPVAPELAKLKETLEPQLAELGQIATVFPEMDGCASVRASASRVDRGNNTFNPNPEGEAVLTAKHWMSSLACGIGLNMMTRSLKPRSNSYSRKPPATLRSRSASECSNCARLP